MNVNVRPIFLVLFAGMYVHASGLTEPSPRVGNSSVEVGPPGGVAVRSASVEIGPYAPLEVGGASIEIGPYMPLRVRNVSIEIASVCSEFVYGQDFEVAAPFGEWSVPSTETTMSGRTFLGQFTNKGVSLSLAALPAHDHLTVSLDLFIIRTWDGNDPPGGPDRWTVGVDGGGPVYDVTFSNTTAAQSYPDAYPGGSHPARTGATEVNTLGYQFMGHALDAVYAINISFAHSASSVQIEFAKPNGAPNDERWGLDNVRVCTGEQESCIPPSDCNGNGLPDECESDCNGNGIPDECDLNVGTSIDCTGDGIPDDCQPDCDGNFIADVCDILAGRSSDCNDNHIPDECASDPDFGDFDCDGDGIGSATDKCPTVADPTNADSDGDGVGEVCDNCPNASNPNQEDDDGDGIGTACDNDSDGDGIPDREDNCPFIFNPGQEDGDNDNIGDVCDPTCDTRLSKQGWTSSESSWWLEPWGNLCDGTAANLHDGFYTWQAWDWWSCVGRVSPRSFTAPAYTIATAGQWIEIDLGSPRTFDTIEVTQWPEQIRCSSLVSPNKYTAYIKDVDVIADDGNPGPGDDVELHLSFPRTLVATVRFPPITKRRLHITYVNFHPTLSSNPTPAIFELDLAAPGPCTPPPLENAGPMPLVPTLNREPDSDGDGSPDTLDEAPYDPQRRIDNDVDRDGVPNVSDNCPTVPNPNQPVAGPGETIVAPTSDGDFIGEACDNCTLANSDQRDCQMNSIGDLCEIIFDGAADADQDGGLDECQAIPTVSQWGLAVIAMLVLVSGTVVFGQRAQREKARSGRTPAVSD